MIRRRMQVRQRSIAAGGALALILAGPHLSSAEPLSLQAVAAAGGAVKAERWAPIHVAIDSTQASFAGELLLTWGDARVRRDIVLPSPGRREFELLLRTSSPEAVIRVALISGGRELQQADAPVRVVGLDDPVTLCVTAPNGVVPDANCTATATPNRLPRSARGYDAIDRLVWPPDDLRLSSEQRTAVDTWRSLRALGLSGDMDLVPQPTRPLVRSGLPAMVRTAVGALAVVCVAFLTIIGWCAHRWRLSPAGIALVHAAGLAALVVFAQLIGPMASAATIQIHHRAVLHQIPHSTSSLLLMRAVAEFPAFNRFALRLPFADGMIEPALSSARPEHAIDEGGMPVLAGTFGLGGRQAFASEAVIDVQPIAIAREGTVITATNRSANALRHCRFADGFAVEEAGAIMPGASVTARQIAAVSGALLTCETDQALVALRAADATVMMHGTTLIAVYEGRSAAAVVDD